MRILASAGRRVGKRDIQAIVSGSNFSKDGMPPGWSQPLGGVFLCTYLLTRVAVSPEHLFKKLLERLKEEETRLGRPLSDEEADAVVDIFEEEHKEYLSP